MVSRQNHKIRYFFNAYESIIQPLRILVIFLLCAFFFWSGLELLVGELPDPTSILPAELVSRIASFFSFH